MPWKPANPCTSLRQSTTTRPSLLACVDEEHALLVLHEMHMATLLSFLPRTARGDSQRMPVAIAFGDTHLQIHVWTSEASLQPCVKGVPSAISNGILHNAMMARLALETCESENATHQGIQICSARCYCICSTSQRYSDSTLSCYLHSTCMQPRRYSIRSALLAARDE